MRTALVLLLLAGPALGQYPWSPTKTPTRRPTLVPTRVPTATPTAAATPVPVPSSPPASVATFSARLATVPLDITSSVPLSRVEVQGADGQWLTVTRGPYCWGAAGSCIGLDSAPTFRFTAVSGAVFVHRVPLTQPRVLLAQAIGPVALVSLTTPQPQ